MALFEGAKEVGSCECDVRCDARDDRMNEASLRRFESCDGTRRRATGVIWRSNGQSICLCMAHRAIRYRPCTAVYYSTSVCSRTRRVISFLSLRVTLALNSPPRISSRSTSLFARSGCTQLYMSLHYVQVDARIHMSSVRYRDRSLEQI